MKQKEMGMGQYLERSKTLQMEAEDAINLERDITIEEIKSTIKNIKMGKSPGPDGYTSLYYKRFGEILIPYFQDYMNSVGGGLGIREESLGAHITLIGKEGKDLTICTSYRPICLINVDIKIYAKILAERIKPLMAGLIDKDQAGFVPGRETRDNILRGHFLIQKAKQSKTPVMFMSLDAEKAFD